MALAVAACEAVLATFRACREAWLVADRSNGPERDRLKAVARRRTDDLLDAIAAAGVATAAPPRVTIAQEARP